MMTDEFLISPDTGGDCCRFPQICYTVFFSVFFSVLDVVDCILLIKIGSGSLITP